MTTSRKDNDQTAPINQNQATKTQAHQIQIAETHASQARAVQNQATDLTGLDPDRSPSGLRKWTSLIDDAWPAADECTHAEEQPFNEVQCEHDEPLDRPTFDALLACIASDSIGLEEDGKEEDPAEDKNQADEQAQAERIRSLNDAFRKSLSGGAIHLTSGIIALGARAQAAILTLVRTFDAFSNDNDPFGEHDSGAFEFGRDSIFWKIDYYDTSLTYGSDNPADPAKTTRVLTIMLASEY